MQGLFKKFYFGGLEDSELLSRTTKADGDTTVKYLILQNDELHKRSERLLADNRRLSADKRQVSDELSRLSRHKVALKGYLANYQELANEYQSLEIQGEALISILRHTCLLLKIYFVLIITISIRCHCCCI